MNVVVVGGGITGLSAAHALRTTGARLLEASPRLGGRIRTERSGGFVIETGPDSFIRTKPHAVDLCRALGLEGELIGTRPGRTVYVWSGGRLHPMPDGVILAAPTKLGPLAGSGLFSVTEKARIAMDLVIPRRKGNGPITLGAFVRRRMGQAALDRIAAPLMAGIYAADPDALDLAATFPLLLDLERDHGSLIAGMVARRHRAQAANPDRARPSGREFMFMSLRGGLSTLVDRAAEAIESEGGDIQLNAEVARVERIGSKFRLHLTNGEAIAADTVVLTTPTHVAADQISRLSPEAAVLLRGIPYASTATVSLAYREGDLARLEGHGFLVARDEARAISACTWSSRKWAHRAPPGFGLIRAYVGGAAAPHALERSDDELIGAVRWELSESVALDVEPVFSRVDRWESAMPQYTPGHLQRLAEIDRILRPLSGLVLAGAGYRGVGIPDCVRQGVEAATRVRSG